MLFNIKKLASIPVCDIRHFVGAYSVDLRNGGAGLLHQNRIIDLSAIWYGSKIRRVGLDQKSVKRYCSASLADSFGVFKGDGTRK